MANKTQAIESLDAAEKGWHAAYRSYLWRWHERTDNGADVQWIREPHRSAIDICTVVRATLDSLAVVRCHLLTVPVEAPDIVLVARVVDQDDRERIEKYGSEIVRVDGKLLLPVTSDHFDESFGHLADRGLRQDRKPEGIAECCRGGTKLWDQHVDDWFSVLRAKVKGPRNKGGRPKGREKRDYSRAVSAVRKGMTVNAAAVEFDIPERTQHTKVAEDRAGEKCANNPPN